MTDNFWYFVGYSLTILVGCVLAALIGAIGGLLQFRIKMKRFPNRRDVKYLAKALRRI